MSGAKDNPWKLLGVTKRFENPWIGVEEHAVADISGTRSGYGVVRFRKQGLGVVPIDGDGNLYLVGQWRYPLGRYLWEIPKGGGDPGEAPQAAAQRELQEELGLVATHWHGIGRFDMSTAVTDEQVTCFLAFGLSPCKPSPDAQEVLAERRLPFAEALALVRRGEISDAVSVVALLTVQARADAGDLPADLAACLRR